MTRMLVVASPSLSPLSTAGPIPTDGQPEWSRCVMDRFRSRDPSKVLNHPHPTKFDGKYPFTVAVWQERAAAQCPGCGCYLPTEDECQPCWSCGTYVPEAVGAVVATVEVTGPSHQPYLGLHHDRCSLERLCHPDALPDCWHTPTSTVTRLDVPIPMERPHAQVDVQRLEDPEPSTIDGVPEPWWWADLTLEVPA